MHAEAGYGESARIVAKRGVPIVRNVGWMVGERREIPTS
jgi:hypothetical protein